MINKKTIVIIFLMFVSATGFAQKTNKPATITFPDSIAPVGINKGLSDSALLDVVQKQTFRFFWHGAHHNWYAKSHLAIDQGPIVVMIENYRTGLLWKLFMKIPDVLNGLKKLGFKSPWIKH